MPELTREIVVDARPETLFRLLTDPAEHVRWMGTEADLDPRPGGRYAVNVAGAYPAAGEFVEVVPHERVVVTFGWDVEGNPLTPGSTTVTWTLTAEGDKTRVRMVHGNLPDEAAVAEHGHGWDHYLDRLTTVGGGDDAGPDTGPTDPGGDR